MPFTEQEMEEFKTESLELLEVGEKSLLAIDTTSDFKTCFDAIFRSFHNLKGAAGMMELLGLQSHTHELESILMRFKDQATIPKAHVSMFLRGIDGARSLLNGQEIQFDFSVTDTRTDTESLEVPAAAALTAPVTTHVENPEGEFFTECEEILERFSSALRVIETGAFAKETLDQLYREMHSLKGAAYLFGYSDLGDLGHVMESSLEPIRDGHRAINKALLDALYQAVECIELEMKALKVRVPNPELKSRIEKVSAILQFAASTSAPPVTPMVVVAPMTVPPPAGHHPNTDTNIAALSKESEVAASIRVPVALLDNLMTLMGEMVLVRNQVLQFSSESEDLNFLNLSQRLNVVTSEIQGEMMKTRMQPIGNILSKFHRVVRDLSQELRKSITLTLSGAETELDKSLLEAIKDPLTHIVRNSCDHGIETPEVRRQAGKADHGTITVKSYHEGGQVVIEIADDGKGLHKSMLVKKAVEKGLITEAQAQQMPEKEIFNLIFAPGFSTAAKVTNVSGRGVGMDVVRTNIEKIGGTVDLTSVVGHGTTIRLKIPLTLAIVPALIVRSAGATFAIPQVKLIELVRIDQSSENKIESLQGAPVYRLRGSILPIIDLNHVLKTGKGDFKNDTIINIAVLNAESHSFGLVVEAIEDTADIVVKPLNRLLKSLHVYSGATILGDGSVALILDVQGIAKVSETRSEGEAARKALQARDQAVAKIADIQDFLLMRVASTAKHAIVLSYVHRLEEFKRSAIEISGNQRVVRYRNAILPIISANEHLKYTETAVAVAHDVINVVVIERGGHLFGIEVDEILDTLSTTAETDTAIVRQAGLIGTLSTESEIVVVIDPFQIISAEFPAFNATVEEERALAAPTRERSGPQKILLVEDSVFFRRLVKKTLEQSGHTVITADDGQDAVDILRRTDTPFDVIVSDIEMPRMNGFQLAMAVRANAVHLATPMLALSSRRDQNYVAQGTKAGFNLYLEKMKPEVLLQAISDLTSVKTTRESA